MIITTWIELKSVHRLVSHLDHLNDCSIRHKNEVMQMNQTVRFGAIKKNVLEKYSTLESPKGFLQSWIYLTWSLGFGILKNWGEIRDWMYAWEVRWVPKITLGIMWLYEILGRDYGTEVPYWQPSRTKREGTYGTKGLYNYDCPEFQQQCSLKS